MSWNYRAIEKEYKGEKYYEIHEVYYNDNGTIYAMSENPDVPYGETLDDLKWSLQHMIDDIGKHEVLNEKELDKMFLEKEEK